MRAIRHHRQIFELQELFIQATLHSKNVLNSDSKLVSFVEPRLICNYHALSERYLQRLIACIGIVGMFVHRSAVRNTVTNAVTEI